MTQEKEQRWKQHTQGEDKSPWWEEGLATALTSQCPYAPAGRCALGKQVGQIGIREDEV
jgi:hypothetical protein